MTDKHLFVHKTRIRVNKQQANFFRGCAGFRRVAYNWGLRRWKLEHALKNEYGGNGPRIGQIDKDFNAIKKMTYGWTYEYPSCVGQMAIKANLKNAFERFFDNLKKGVPFKEAGYPKFKNRKSALSFQFTNSVIRDDHICGNRIKLPKKQGYCRLSDTTRHRGRLLSTTISERSGKWYAAMLYELDYEPEYETAPPDVVGIDMGVARRVSVSCGAYTESPARLKKLDAKRRRIQRKMAKRQQPGKGKRASNRWKKLNRSVNRIESKRADIRKNQAHQITSVVARKNSLVVIEDLRIKNMTAGAQGTIEAPGKNVKAKSGLNREMLNAGLYEIRRQLAYKCVRHKGMMLAVDPKYTSQKCSECGHTSRDNRKYQSLFKCVECGFSANADHNAAINIKNRGIISLSA